MYEWMKEINSNQNKNKTHIMMSKSVVIPGILKDTILSNVLIF